MTMLAHLRCGVCVCVQLNGMDPSDPSIDRMLRLLLSAGAASTGESQQRPIEDDITVSATSWA